MQDHYKTSGNQLNGITAAELMEKDFPEPKWAIPGILPEGLNILGGKPKKGKSLIALNICLDIASGKPILGKMQADKGPVIYFSLEDSFRRLQERLGMMLQREEAPKNLYLYNVIAGGENAKLLQLDEAIKKIPELRLVVIDTLAKFLPAANTLTGNHYEDDYQRISKIKMIADKYRIPILLIHHLRKLEADNVMDTFLGSQGLTGAADGLLAMVDGKGQSERNLIITGRDIEETDFSLKFDPDTLRWILIGNASETRSTPKQQKITDLLKNNLEPLTPMVIAEKSKESVQYIKNLLPKLIRQGCIKKTDRGLYAFVDIK